MKKILGLILFSLIGNTFAVIATEDMYVMQKDTAEATSFVTTTMGMLQSAQSQYDALKNATSLVDGIQAVQNIDASKFCPSCSDVTVEQLTNWQEAMSKNWCETFNNNLGLIQGNITSVESAKALVAALPAAIASGNPAQVAAAFSQAQTSTLSQMNTTQQQMAAYTMQNSRQSEINAKITQMKTNKAMYGVACPDCKN